MKVFISWSGDLSRSIATELFDWLPMVVQSVQPYMSSESIDKGTRWASSIADELEGTSVGIVVLTKENRAAPWINFEAGALAKVVGDSRLAPLIFGLKPSEVGTPLSQFQVTQFNKEDVLRLLKSINSCAGDEALPDYRLEKMHDALWAQLDLKLQPIIASSIDLPPANPDDKADESSLSKALEEILTLTRQQAHVLMNPERMLSPDIVRQIVDAASTGGIDARGLDAIKEYLGRAQFIWSSINSIISTYEFESKNVDTAEVALRVSEFDMLLTRIADTVHGRRKFYPHRSRQNRNSSLLDGTSGLMAGEEPK